MTHSPASFAFPLGRGEYIIIRGTIQKIKDLLNFTDDMINDLETLQPNDAGFGNEDINLFMERRGCCGRKAIDIET